MCGDASCNGAESCSSCPGDCGACSSCGNGLCEAGETDATCGQDCGCAAPLSCNDQAPAGCWCDIYCAANGDCCADVGVCPLGGCNGYCDDQSPDGCWCDDYCLINGDCCPNACSVCGKC
jgi:hypothetical protein